MERIIFIYTLIFIIFISIFIYGSQMKKEANEEENMNEKFNPLNSQKNTPNFVKGYLNKRVSSDPNYRVENINQFNYDRLYEKLQGVNEEKVELKAPLNYTFYTVNTTDDKLRRDLDIITKYVLLIINQDNYYNFAKTNYGDVKIYTDKHNNANYIYELFLWDKKNYFEIKLLINIIKFPKKNKLYKFGIKQRKYIFTDYLIGFPSADQLIPLPLSVIPTQNKGLNEGGINKNDALPAEYYYLNQINIQNSTLIINYEKNNFNNKKMNIDEQGFSGITDMSLEYVGIQTNNNPFLEKSKKYNSWPTLDEEPKWKGQYPAKTPPRDWDVDSVYYYSKDDKAKARKNDTACDAYDPGTIWSPMKMPLQPQSWPTLATIPRNCGENYWLFNQVGPQNTFFGGGKQ